MDSVMLRRSVAFLVALLAVTAAFSFQAFVTYQNDLQKVFKLQQTQVQLLMGANWIGLAFTLPFGLFLQRFGLRAGTSVALCVSFTSNLLIWSAIRHAEFYTEHWLLLAFYFLLVGCGASSTFLSAMEATGHNFHPSRRGTALGALSAGTSFGPILFIAAYSYSDPGPNPIFSLISSHIENYFLFVSVSLLTVNILGLCAYGHFLPHDAARYSSSDKEAILAEESESTGEAVKMSVVQLLADPTFHLIAWPAILVLGLVPMDIQNLMPIAQSFGKSDYRKTLLYLSPISGLIFKLTIGSISDILSRSVGRASVVLFTSVLCVFIYLISATWLDSIGVLVTNILAVNLSGAVVWCSTPVMLTEHFGIQNLPLVWGVTYAAFAVVAFVYYTIFGVNYDMALGIGQTQCSGTVCYHSTFIMATAMSTLAAVLTCFHIRMKQHKVDGHLTALHRDEIIKDTEGLVAR